MLTLSWSDSFFLPNYVENYQSNLVSQENTETCHVRSRVIRTRGPYVEPYRCIYPRPLKPTTTKDLWEKKKIGVNICVEDEEKI